MSRLPGIASTTQLLVARVLSSANTALSPVQFATFRRALAFATEAHFGQTRDDDTEYIAHPIRVAEILVSELRVDAIYALCAALLHDVLEDNASMTKRDIDHRFGPRVGGIVWTLTKPCKNKMTRAKVNAEYFPRIRRSDLVTRIVKLADRLDNLRDLKNSRVASRRVQMLAETRAFYLPLIEELEDGKIRRALSVKFARALREVA